ncbi:MAG TPA: EamA family transporter [Candidatus Limnocylindrales bacterium]|nr:EamA family transporter [Candidatus Limnocylindrales bacterium]
MIAVLGGTLAALCWAVASLAASRAARALGARVVLAWVMLVGLVLAIPLVAATGIPALDGTAYILLAVSGLGNVLGLLLAYTAFSRGKVGVVAPIISTEGALAALVAVALGEPMEFGVALALAAIAGGVVLASRDGTGGGEAGDGYVPVAAAEPAIVPEVMTGHRSDDRRAALVAIASALSFGVALYATGRIGAELTIGLTVLPSRLAGALLVALPLAAGRRLRATRPTVPLLLLIGCLEVVGVLGIAVGSTDAIAVTAVVSSQFAGLAALLAFLVFGERLRPTQILGVGVIALGVAAVALLRA